MSDQNTPEPDESRPPEPGAERAERLERLCRDALALPSEGREAWLRERCAGDEALLREALELISLAETGETVVDRAVAPGLSAPTLGAPDPSPSPERIGPYRILRELGRGGMGSVYLASLEKEDFRQRVALKLIKRGMDSEHILRRFELERKLLGALNHPSIARMLDAGMSEDGRPYFVMEYVEGQPIDKYCDSHKLRIAERLALFRRVCAGVHHMHQNLVVHRDLKPSNVLVTAEGEPKIVDLGIAKLLNPELAGLDAAPTATDLRLMTPEYASPEQVRGEPITTAADIYSLGVLLYELLTGHRPYRIRTRLQAEIERIICELDPERPSTAVRRTEQASDAPPTPVPSGGETGRTITPESVSRVREGRPERLRRRLLGDLDNIILMALRKEPQRRYPSAEALAEDIDRHMRGLPVTACPDSAAYRFNKFVRRNRTPVAAAAGVFLALAAGLALAGWQASVAGAERDRAERALLAVEQERTRVEEQRQRAQANFDAVRDLANTFLYAFHDSVRTLAGSTEARELVVTEGLKYLERLAEQAADDPELMQEIAEGYFRVGEIQGGLRGGNLGSVDEARESFERSLAMRRRLAEADPNNPDLQGRLFTAHRGVGDALDRAGDTPAALEHYESALEAADEYERLGGEPAKADQARDLAENRIATLLRRTGDIAGAIERMKDVLEGHRRRATSDPGDLNARRSVSVAHIRLSDMLSDAGDTAVAIDHARRALVIREDLLNAEPESGRFKRDVMVACDLLGNALLAAGRVEPALESFRRQTALAEQLHEADDADERARTDLIRSRIRLADALAEDGGLAEAREQVEDALALIERGRERRPDARDLDGYELAIRVRLGNLALEEERPLEAIASYRRFFTLATERRSSDPTNLSKRREVGIAHQKIGMAMDAARDPDQAEDSLRAALEIFEGLVAQDEANVAYQIDLATTRRLLAEALASQGAAGEAVEHASAAQRSLEQVLQRDPAHAAAREELAEAEALIDRIGAELPAPARS